MLKELDLGFVSISLYAPLFLFGFAIALIWIMRLKNQTGLSKRAVLTLGIYGIIGLFFGAKLFYMILRLPDVAGAGIFADGGMDLYNVFNILFGGMVFYGGLIGFCTGVVVFCRKYSFDKYEMLDIVAPFLPLAHAFGRIGCFLNGCCYGIEYDGPLCVRYPEDVVSPHVSGVARFPVQLLEAGLNLCCFTVLYLLLKKMILKDKGTADRRLKPGQLIGIYLAYYSVARFFLEFLRGDMERGFIGNLSSSQFISLLMLPIALYLLFRKKMAPENRSEERLKEN